MRFTDAWQVSPFDGLPFDRRYYLTSTGHRQGAWRKQRKRSCLTLIDVDKDATGAVHDGFLQQAAEKLV
jgi:hypothetical protein